MKGHDLELKRHPNRSLSHARVIYRRGMPPRRRTGDTPDRTRSHGLPQPNNTRQGRTDGCSDSPGTCSSERGGPQALEVGLAPQGGCLLSDSGMLRPGPRCRLPPQEGWARPRGHRQASSCRG